jgi:hypothetical protein
MNINQLIYEKQMVLFLIPKIVLNLLESYQFQVLRIKNN